MKNTTYHITLDVHSNRESCTLRLKQGTSAHSLYLRLTEEGLSYPIDPLCTAVLAAEKPDGTILYNACRICDGAAIYTLSGQETNTPGYIPCELRLYDGEGKLLISPTFCLLVEEAVYSDGAISDSSPEFTALTELMHRSTALLTEIEQHRPFLNSFSLRAEAAMEQGELIAIPVVHPGGETPDGLGLACILPSESMGTETDPEGRVEIPTVGKVLELICSAQGLDFSAMDTVIGGK